MKIIHSNKIVSAVRDMFISANLQLPYDAEQLIYESVNNESNEIGKSVLKNLCKNLETAKKLGIPICQDTGMAVLFADIGQEVCIEGELFENAVNEGVRQAYIEGYMRCSVVNDPLFNRKNTNDNTPAIIYTRIVAGDKIVLDAAPKGFGSENMSRQKMFNPSVNKEDIISFVENTVIEAGSNPCPPIIVGVGIGGTFDYSTVLAKRALIRPVSIRNNNPDYRELENEILIKLNKTGIGPQGFGGDTTVFAVNIEYAPTHIAGLPVAVNINCHVMRHARKIL